jgi:hypothetical protein
MTTQVDHPKFRIPTLTRQEFLQIAPGMDFFIQDLHTMRSKEPLKCGSIAALGSQVPIQSTFQKENPVRRNSLYMTVMHLNPPVAVGHDTVLLIATRCPGYSPPHFLFVLRPFENDPIPNIIICHKKTSCHPPDSRKIARPTPASAALNDT